MKDSDSAGRSLVELLRGHVTDDSVPDITIFSVASNSRMVSQGSLFIALPGTRAQGIDFAIDAVKSGAAAVIYDAQDEYCLRRIRLLSKWVQTNWIGVDNLERVNGEIVSRFYGEPGKYLKIVGITGTDGKTSVTHLITQALARLGKSVASIGTLGHGVGPDLVPATHTTPDAVTLQTWLYEFWQMQCEYVIMEVSSHALHQYRVSGCQFDIAVLTNLGRDHLDYHQGISQYAAAKGRFFRDFDLSGRVLNADDTFGLQLSRECESEGMIRYTGSPSERNSSAEVYLLDSDITRHGFDIQVATPVGEIHAHTALIGRFNIDNTLACISSLVALGLDQDQIQDAVSDLQPIPGRLEKIDDDPQLATAIIDFAHTEQALRACLAACREHTSGQLWCVFGCGGDRDRGKRPGMGCAAEELADRVVITDDNPRTEDPERIVTEILKGFRNPGEASVVHDRQAAIAYALSQANSDDLVVIAGKGHEVEQIIGHERYPFSDRHMVQRFMQVSA